jgi:hypothetical protein
MRSRTSTKLLTAAATIGAALALAAPASAGLVVETTADCPAQPVSQPFSRWLDPFSYQLAPGGSFEEGAAGWRLGGARVVSGNEPWRVAGSDDSYSLRIPAGASVTSEPVCVGLEHPTVRFFVRKNSGLLSTLVVSATVTLQGGGTLTVPVGVVVAGSSWTPTLLPIVFAGNLLPLLPGQYTPVSFRFTPILGGDWQIDDVYVDPWKMSR